MSPNRPTLSLNRDQHNKLYLLVGDGRGHTHQIDLGQGEDQSILADLALQCEDLAAAFRFRGYQIMYATENWSPSKDMDQVQMGTPEDYHDRYTSEGIDRYFQATPGFIADVNAWERDSVNDWTNLSDLDLVRCYQLHFESYVQGCAMEENDPTYYGFRHYLKALKDDPSN